MWLCGPTNDLWPLWHHSSSHSKPCVGHERPLNGPPTLPLLSPYSLVIRALNGTLGPICEYSGWTLHDEHWKAVNTSTRTSTFFLEIPQLVYNATWGSFNLNFGHGNVVFDGAMMAFFCLHGGSTDTLKKSQDGCPHHNDFFGAPACPQIQYTSLFNRGQLFQVN